jgi:hypothetical protein
MERAKVQEFKAVLHALKKNHRVRVVQIPSAPSSRKNPSADSARQVWALSARFTYAQSRCEGRSAEHDEKVIVLVKCTGLRQLRLETRELHDLIGPPLAQARIRRGYDGMFYIRRNARLLVKTRLAGHKTTDGQSSFRQTSEPAKDELSNRWPRGPEQVRIAHVSHMPATRQFID